MAGGACPCQAGFWCEMVDLSQTGTCKAVLTAGATCEGWSCAPGLICAGEPATCKALAGEGDACTPADGPTECGEGYHCDTTTKKCVSDPSVGSACASDVFCLNAYCDETTTPSAPVCKALVADGGACTDDEQCGSFSCTSGKCDAAGDGSCLAP